MRPKEIVKSGYDKIASSYSSIRTSDSEDVQLLRLLVERLPLGAVVLDAGCGSGYPVTQVLSRSSRVTGVDFAKEQVLIAKRTVPDAEFILGDITDLPVRDCAFDAICSYYAIIHVPRNEHSKLLRDFHRILKPGGLALLCLGRGDLPEDIGGYHGTQMYWSHYDDKMNLRMMKEGGFDILWFKTVEDPIDPPAAHLFVLGQKR